MWFFNKYFIIGLLVLIIASIIDEFYIFEISLYALASAFILGFYSARIDKYEKEIKIIRN